MAETLKTNEAIPASYPDAPANLSTAAAALEAAMVWQRLEVYTAHRWSERAVAWTVEGPGQWRPPLTPASIDTVEVWRDDAWQDVELSPSALGGYILPGAGPYRFMGTAGDDEADVPAAVLEAYKRLAEYIAQSKGKAGASSERIAAGSIALSHRRDPAWMAHAMQNSGAADLLRSYRRA